METEVIAAYAKFRSASRLSPRAHHIPRPAPIIRRGLAWTIVTSNTRRFPDSSRLPYLIDLYTPDEYPLDLWDLSGTGMMVALHKQATGLKRPPMTVEEVVERLGGVVPRCARVVLESGLADVEPQLPRCRRSGRSASSRGR
jgi:hypothetical protein